MSDITLLRKLTEKSVMKFGQYFDTPLFILLNQKKHTYLRWVYFNCSNITFMDNIILQIGILPEEFIKKPGTNPEMFEIVKNRLREHLSEFELKKIEKISAKRFNAKMISENKKQNLIFSKSNMTRKNHGH
jgi:hypothetical protein